MIRFSTSACKRNVLAVALTLSQTILLAPLAVQASDNSVRVAGQVVFSTKAASGGMSTDQRAETIQRNLDNALVAAQDRSPAAVNIVYVKGVPVITLGGYQVVTVSSADAKAEGTTPALLAQRWADSLRGSLQDSSSVNSYVGQLTGNYSASAPPTAAPPTAPAGVNNAPDNSGNAGSNQAYNPPPPQNNVPYQPYNQAQSGNYGGPGPNGGYGGPGPNGGYGQPSYNGYDQYNRNTYGGPGGPGGPMQRGRVVYAPAGLVMPVSLRTSISTQAAQAGDLVEAQLSQPVNLGDTSLAPGTVLVGQITNAKAGGFLGRSGMLGITFNRIRTPDGVETPMSAHIVGGIGKYAAGADGEVRGETWKNKVGQVALRGAIGAGTGAALGTAIGAIAGRGGRGAGRGAWSGTAIGGGLGVADSLLLRKGRDVTIRSGTPMQVQLDAPVALSGGGTPPYTGAF